MKNLEITKEELKSLKNYLGPKQDGINCVGTNDVSELVELQKNGSLIAKDKEELEDNIKDFVNIYSLIYKNYLFDPSEFGFSAKQKVDLLDKHLIKENIPTNKFSSALTNLDLVMDLEEIEQQSIVELLGDENIPFLDIKKFIKKYPEMFEKEIKKSTKENQILLPPYIKAAKVNKSMSSLFKDYEVSVEKCELEIGDSDIEKDKKSLTDDYDKYLEFIKEREDLNNNPKADSKRKRWLSVRINAYTKKMSEVVRHMCAIKEKEISRDYQSKMRVANKQKIEDNYSQLERNIIDSFDSMIKVSNEYNELAKEIKIENAIDLMRYDISDKVIAIRDNIKKQRINPTQTNAEKLSQEALEASEKLKELAVEYNKKTEENFKEELYMKVQGAIKVAKIWSYGNQIEILEEERSNIIDKITGKDLLKREQIRGLKLKIQKEKEAVLKKEKYPIKEMMTDIFYTSKHNLNGKFTPEMKELSDFIVKNYGVTVKYEGGKQIVKKYSEDIIEQLVSKREEKEVNNSNLPVVQEYSFFGNRRMAKQLKEQNDEFEATIKPMQRNTIFLEDFRKRNTGSKIYETLSNIERLTNSDRDDEKSYRSVDIDEEKQNN